MNISFNPLKLGDYFVELTKISRPSGKENPARIWIIEQINCIKEKYLDNRKNIEITLFEPEATDIGKRNIAIRRNGTNNYKKASPIILQAHIDMVTVPSDDIFPIKLEIVEEDKKKWLQTIKDINNEGSTLGADDGIGVATILAVLEDEELVDIPFEALFTVEEETSLKGAKNFDKSLLTGNKLINLDSEDINIITYGCAGGAQTELIKEITRNSQYNENDDVLKIEISGLKSGHSGEDINKCRLNGIKVISEILIRMNSRMTHILSDKSISSYEYLINDYKRTDIVKSNSIPAKCEVVISIDKKYTTNFIDDIKTIFNLIKAYNLPDEVDMEIKIKKIEENQTFLPLDKCSTDIVLSTIHNLPNGVIKMIATNENTVETSTNICNIFMDSESVKINTLNRSSNINSMECLNNIQFNVGRCYGFKTQINLNTYPIWQPNEESNLLKIAKEVYFELFEGKYIANVIHAGLECGWVVEKFNGKIDCISIGPTIRNPHSKFEKLLLEDNGVNIMELYYKALLQIIKSCVKS